MKNEQRTYTVETIFGTTATLWSDDTHTLYFGQGFDDQSESTPETLSESISVDSLRRIAGSSDHNDSSKAEAAMRTEKNVNGYVIYPQNINVMDLAKARKIAAEFSVRDGEPTRIEDCDTERVIARFRDGQEGTGSDGK